MARVGTSPASIVSGAVTRPTTTAIVTKAKARVPASRSRTSQPTTAIAAPSRKAPASVAGHGAPAGDGGDPVGVDRAEKLKISGQGEEDRPDKEDHVEGDVAAGKGPEEPRRQPGGAQEQVEVPVLALDHLFGRVGMVEVVGMGFGVEDIARDQHMACAIVPRGLCEATEDGVARLGEPAADLPWEAREPLAQVKIRGMDKSQIGHWSSPRAANLVGPRLIDIR